MEPDAQKEVNRLRRALLTLDGRLKEAPRNAEVAVALAETLLRLALRTEDPARRVQYLVRACQVDPYDPRLRVQLALARKREGDTQGMQGCLLAATAVAPGDPRPWLALGRFHLDRLRQGAKAKVADLAIDAFARAAEADPRLSEPHLGRLEAAILARVVAPEKSRLATLLPDALLALRPTVELLPRIGCLGLCMAFAIHYPRHAPLKKSAKDDKQRAADRLVRRKHFQGLLAGLRPFHDRFPGDPGLSMIGAAVEILDAEDEALPEHVAAAAGRFSDARLLHLFVHQRVEEIREPERRAEVLMALAGRMPLTRGLAEEVLAALNSSARAAVQGGDHAQAERAWKQGLTLDRYSLALHHNLALLALCRRDAAALGVHLGNTVELLLTYWQLAPGGRRYLERLAARHESFAGRLRTALEQTLARAEGAPPEGDLIAAWLREAQASLALRGALLHEGPGTQAVGMVLPGEAREALVGYIRDLGAATAAGGLPAALHRFLDPPLHRPPPLHYEALGIPADAPPSEVKKRYTKAFEELGRTVIQAQMTGEERAAQRAIERLARLEKAYEVLSDPTRRRRYDSECIPPAEHGFHMTRRRFVQDLHDFAHTLEERKAPGLSVLLCRAYHQVPHEQIDPYFELLQPGVRTLIRNNMASLGVRPLVNAAQERMSAAAQAAGGGAEARDLLIAALAAGARGMRYVHYLLAVCELRMEEEHIEKHHGKTAPGVQMHEAPSLYAPTVRADRCLLIVHEVDAEGEEKLRCVPVNGPRAVLCVDPSSPCTAWVRLKDGEGTATERAAVERGQGGWRLRSLSAEGAAIRVNGVRLAAPVPLQTGDHIILEHDKGAAHFSFFLTASPPEVLVGKGENGFTRARYYIAHSLLCAAEDEEFSEKLTKLLDSVDSADRMAVLRPAIKLMNEEKWAAAQAILDKVLKQQPGHAGALYHLAICLLKRDRPAEAAKAAAQARQRADDAELRKEAAELEQAASEQAAVRSAMAAFEADNFAEAIRLFRQLPPKIRELSNLKLVYNVARARHLLRNGRYGVDAAELNSVRTDLLLLSRGADDTDVRASAGRLLQQLNMV